MSQVTLFVGLGNPGPQYAMSRHNVGFAVMDSLAEAWGLTFQKCPKGMLAKGQVDGQRVLLLKPTTYMNLSGECVGPLMKFYDVDLNRVCVVHDDIDLDEWRIKVKKGAGAGGHNGLKSLDQHITPMYWRVRVGVGRPPLHMSGADHVLRVWEGMKPDYVHPLADHLAEWIHTTPENWLSDWQQGERAKV